MEGLLNRYEEVEVQAEVRPPLSSNNLPQEDLYRDYKMKVVRSDVGYGFVRMLLFAC